MAYGITDLSARLVDRSQVYSFNFYSQNKTKLEVMDSVEKNDREGQQFPLELTNVSGRVPTMD